MLNSSIYPNFSPQYRGANLKKNICFHKIQIQCYKNISNHQITNVFILSSPTGFRTLSTRSSSFDLFVLSPCPFDISVGVGAFVTGLGQISSFLSVVRNTHIHLLATKILQNLSIVYSLPLSSHVIIKTVPLRINNNIFLHLHIVF